MASFRSSPLHPRALITTDLTHSDFFVQVEISVVELVIISVLHLVMTDKGVHLRGVPHETCGKIFFLTDKLISLATHLVTQFLRSGIKE